MKKLLVCAVLCLLFLPAQALAAVGRSGPEPLPGSAAYVFDALRAAWGKNYENAPDVGGLYWDNDTKRTCVLLVDGGTEDRKQEAIALAGHGDWVSFKSCKYSYAKLKAVMDEVSADREAAAGGSGVAVHYIDVKANHVTVGILKDVLEPVGRSYKERYGDMVHIEEGHYIIKTDGDGRGPGIPETGDAAGLGWLPALLLGCLCLGLGKRAESHM